MKLEMRWKPGDVLLLKILACVLIVFIGARFFLLPGIEKHQRLEGEKQVTALKKEEMEYSIAQIPLTEQRISEKKAELPKKEKPYYPPMENREVDELVTGIMLRYGLHPVYLSIGEEVKGVPQPYLVPKEEGEDSAGAQEAVPYLGSISVHMTVEGSRENIIAFLDGIAKEQEGILVRSFEVSERAYLTLELEKIAQSRCQCVLEIYTHGEIEDTSK